MYKLSKGEIIFLVHITELLVKTLEQSAIANNSPSLNSESNVYFKYSHWDENWLNQKALLSGKSKSVLVFSEISKEPILGPLSIHQTTKILGVSKDIVPRYLNFDNGLLERKRSNRPFRYFAGIYDSARLIFHGPNLIGSLIR